MSKLPSVIFSCAVLSACTSDGGSSVGQYADVTISDVKMSRLVECETQLQELTDKLAVKASFLAGQTIKPAVVIRQVDAGIFATAEVSENVVTINPVLCKTGIAPRVRYIIAHELGHYVAEKLNLSKGGAYSVVGKHRISEQAERDADNFAAQILGENGISASEYLHRR